MLTPALQANYEDFGGKIVWESKMLHRFYQCHNILYSLLTTVHGGVGRVVRIAVGGDRCLRLDVQGLRP